MVETQKKKRRKRELLKRWIALILVLCMVLSDGNLLNIVSYAAERGIVAVPVTIVTSKGDQDSGGSLDGNTDDMPDDLKNDGRVVLLENGKEMRLKLTFNLTAKDGTASDPYLDVQLPYFFTDSTGKLIATYDLADVPVDQRGEKLMGICADVEQDGGYWYDDGSGQTPTEENPPQSQNLQGTFRLIKTGGILSGGTGQVVVLKLRFFGADIPENATGVVNVGGGYREYTNDNGDSSEMGYYLKPENNKDNSYTLVNSNLKWDTTVEQVGQQVLWDQYNYMTYKVTIKNTSDSEKSYFEPFAINFNVPSAAEVNTGQGGILDEDLMAWIYDKNTGAVTENTSVQIGKDEFYTGVPGKGGVLIYDVTDQTDAELAKWDTETYNNVPSGVKEKYYSVTNNRMISFDVDEKMTKGQSKTYYIAVPFTTNFADGSDYKVPTTFWPTIYLNEIKWTKTRTLMAEFSKPQPDFTHEKYVLDNKGKKAEENEIAIRGTGTYYISGFKNTGNLPAFNPVVTDTLPENYDLNKITIQMDNDSADAAYVPDLSEWFKTDKLLEFCFEDTTDPDAEPIWVELGSFGSAVATDTGREWTLDLNDKIEDYLKANPDYAFTRKMRFNLAERINKGKAFNGRIAVEGVAEKLAVYENNIVTNYTEKIWAPKTTGTADGDPYQNIPKVVETDKATLTTAPARPTIWTQGYRKKADGTYTYSTPASADDDELAVPLRYHDVGFKYILGNNSISPGIPLEFNSGNLLPFKDAEGNYTNTGLFLEKIVLSKKLLENATIDYIEISSLSGSSVKINGTSLPSADADGNRVILRSSWNKKVSYAAYVTIVFKEFKENVALSESDGAYLLLDGYTNRVGHIEVEGSFETKYNNTQFDSTSTNIAILNSSAINPIMDAVSYDNAGHQSSINNGVYTNVAMPTPTNLIVPKNMDDAGYIFHLSNGSESGAAETNLWIDFTNTGIKNTTTPSVVKGFIVKDITFSKELDQVGKIAKILFYDYDQEPKDTTKTSTPIYTLEWADVTAQADGSYKITDALWDQLGATRIKTIQIVFEEVYGQNDKDHPEKLEIKVNGNTDQWGDMDALMTFEPLDETMTDKKMNVTGRLTVESAVLSVHSNIIYYDVTEANHATPSGSAKSTDGYQTRLGIPYDRDFRYRVSIENDAISVLDDVDMTIKLPTIATEGADKDNGFHLTKVHLKKELIEQFEQFESITFVGQDGCTEKTYIYDANTKTLYIEESGLKKELPKLGDDWVFTEKDIDVSLLETLVFKGKRVIVSDDTTEDAWIDFYGYSDGEFETQSMIEVDSNHYQDGIREAVHTFSAHDSSIMYVSKMYFDTVLAAGYKDTENAINANAEATRFDQVSSALEHMRIGYQCSHWGDTCYWGENDGGAKDNSELDIGYKAIGSFMLDFRQYLNVGTNYPNDYSHPHYESIVWQEHEGKNWIKTQSFNTKANVEMTMDIPSEYFDAYYVKVRPDTLSYLKSIDIIYKDGSTVTYTSADWNRYQSSVETYKGEQYVVIPVAELQNGTYTNYRSPYGVGEDSYQTENPVTNVVFNVDINEKASDDDRSANNPDFGSGFNAQNESTKYMFEVTGRFYRTDDINQKVEAGVSTELKIGGTTRGDVTSKERTSKASDADVTSSKNRSYWSYWNKYWRNNYSTTREDYDAGHMVSTVRVNVENDNNMVLKGVHNDPTVDYDDEVEFGTKNYYSIAYFRTHGTIHCDYKGGRDADWNNEDLDDWSGKLSFVDQVCLEDTLPPIGYYDGTKDYHGFRTEDILFSQKLYKYLDYVEFTLSNGEKITIAKADLKWNSTKNYYEVLLRYKELNESVTAGSKNEIELEAGVFLSSYKAYLKDIPGSADYARELLGTDLEVVDNHGGTSNVAAKDYLRNSSGEIIKHNGSASEIDIKVGGYVHTIKGVDPDAMGTNKIVASYKTDNMTKWENRYRYSNNWSSVWYDHGSEIFKTSENTGRLMGYRIPFSAGWRVDKLVNGSVDNGSVEYDYETNNITPNETSFGVTIWNRPDGSTGKTQSARMKSGTVTTTLPDAYNLKRINIPKELVDGTWFHVAGITLNYNGQSKTFSGADLTNALKTDGGNYYLDVNAFEIENQTQFATYTCANTTETYVNEHINSFVMVYEAVNPNVTNDASLLDGGQYISKDKAKGYAFTYDGVWVNRSEADLTSDVYNANSRPTFGMVQNPNSNVEMRNYTNITFVSADANAEDNFQTTNGPNRETFANSLTYYAKNLIGQMVVRVDRGEASRFAYDRVTDSTGATSEYAVDKDYLLPYDYVNYTLTAGASTDSPIPLQHTDLQFVVPKGQRIIGWEIKSNTITSVANTDIVATVKNGSTDIALNPNIYYVKEDGVDTNYKELNITLGAKKGTMDGDMIKAGEKVEIIVYTQFLDEFGSTANPVAFENQPIVAKYYASSTPKHTYSQYGIFAQDSSGNKKDTWSGHVSSAYEYRYYEEEYNTKSEVDYYRYDIKENAVDGNPAAETYTSEVRSKLTIRDVQDNLKLEYIYTDVTSQYDRQGMQIKVYNNGNGGKKTDVTNDTRHELDEITFEVSFLSQHNKSDNTERWFKSFELTKKPTFYYPANNNRANAGSVVPDEDIEYLVEVDGEEVWVKADKIKEGKVTEQEAADGWHSVTEARKVRWTYRDISDMGTDGKEVLFASQDNPFLFEGLGLYNNLRENKKTQIADRYDMKLDATVTAVHTHRDDRNDSEHVLNFKGTGNITTVIARERPVLTYQTQIFGSQGEAEAAYQYNAAQKNGYRPGDEMWYKVTVKNNKLTTEADAKKYMQGALLDPVFYDKIPEYVTPDMSTIQIRWIAADGTTVKTSDASIMNITKTQMDAADFGGDTIATKNTYKEGSRGNSHGYTFDDINPTNGKSESSNINYDVYEISFADGTRLEAGEQIEIWYSVRVREENLPMNYVRDSAGNVYPEYYPKIGSWYQINFHWSCGASVYGMSWPLGTSGRAGALGAGALRNISNSNIMMDMSYLIHDVGISGTLNKDVDKWEFLKDSTTYIPGSATNNGDPNYCVNPQIYGNNKRYLDTDSASGSVYQPVIYCPSITKDSELDILPTTIQYQGVAGIQKGDGNNRDIYELIVKYRTDVTETAWDNQSAEEHVPILWSEARSHLQTAWIATSSEIIPDHDATDTNEIQYSNHAKQYLKNGYTAYKGYNLTNPLYGMYVYNDTGENARQDLLADDYVPTLEYDEEFTSRLSAYNYGDWGVDGVEFIYVLPRGISPVKENGKYLVTGTTLTGGDSSAEVLSDISADNIDVEVLQTPTGEQKYLSPKSVQDPILSNSKWNTTGDTYDEQYYTEEDSESWVLKITVRQPLKKWFNRGEDKGYILHVDVRCHVDSTNESEYWYDKVFTRPIETDGGNDSAYYQIYDISLWDGDTKEKANQGSYSLSTQYAGMDYLWDGYNYYMGDGAILYNTGSINTPYINGFNIQNNEVFVDSDVNGINSVKTSSGQDTNGDSLYSYYSSGNTTTYASTGTRAQMRKPMLRTWTTMGDDLGENWKGSILEQYYTNVEGEQSAINIHVENKYYWDELATNGHGAMTGYNDGNSTIKHLHNYSTDGGNEGTFFFPVVTNILPAGTVPMYKVEENGKVIYKTFTTDNVENAKHTVDWILYDNSGTVLPDEQCLYTAKVEYVEITNDDGVKEGRYKVVFWQDQNTKDVREDAKIVSGDKRIFSFRMVTVAEPDMNLKDGTTASDLLKQYQTNRVYVTSQLEGFKFKIDSDVNGNPYCVGAKWSPYYASKYNVGDNVRTDSILNTVHRPGTNSTNDTGGALPNSNITILKNLVNGSKGVTYSIIDPVQTNGVRRYYESGEKIKAGEATGIQTADDILNAEDYTEIRSGLPLDLDGLQTDFNMSGSITHVDAVSDGKYSDSGVYTSMRIRTKSPCIKVDAKVSQELAETNPKDGLSNTSTTGVTHYPTTGFDNKNYVKSDSDHKQYGDELYYTAVISNKPDKTTAPEVFEQKGDVLHSKIILAVTLPSIVSYEGDAYLETTIGGNLQRIEVKDLDTVGEQVSVDVEETVTDAAGLTTTKYHTWQIKLRSHEVDEKTEKETLVFEIITPNSSGEKNGQITYEEFLQGEHLNGYFASGDEFNFKVKTVIDNLGTEESVLDTPDYWDEEYYADMYVSLEETDGSYLEQTISDKLSKQSLNKALFINEENDSPRTDTDPEVDYDLDQNYDDHHASDKTARVTILKPSATVRLDTEIKRIQLSNPDAGIIIAEDASIKGATISKIYLDQAVNTGGAVGEFIVDYRLPHRGTTSGTIYEAPMSASSLETTVYNIRTGVWEIPESVKQEKGQAYYDALKENLRVSVYVMLDNTPENKAYDEPGSEDAKRNNWIQLTGRDYALDENAVIDIESINEDYMTQICQIRFVVRSSEDVDVTKKYPVPQGFRLDIDANMNATTDPTTGDVTYEAPGDQEMDEVDPTRANVEWPADKKKENNVAENAAFVEISMRQKENASMKLHANNFATVWGRYDDTKYAALSEQARAGYFINVELPVIQKDLKPWYFNGSFGNYSWSDTKLLVDPGVSSMLRYTSVLKNLSESQIEEAGLNEDPDYATNPTISVVLPYLQAIDDDYYAYVDAYSADYTDPEKCFVNEEYKAKAGLNAKKAQWSFKVVDEEGNQVSRRHITDVQFSTYEKMVDLSGNARKVLTWNFTGRLNPGESIVVEYMVPISTKDYALVSNDLMTCSSHGYLQGSFKQYIPESMNSSETYSVEVDARDVNNNGKTISETALIKRVGGIGFATSQKVDRSKYAYSEYDTAGLQEKRPALVPEGTNYKFKASAFNPDTAGNIGFKKTILYDVLPHIGDSMIALDAERNSKWSGWVLPNTIKVKKSAPSTSGLVTTEMVDGTDCEIWVGPFTKENGKIVAISVEDLPEVAQTSVSQFYEDAYVNKNGIKDKYFVKLSEILALESTDPELYLTLSKSIMAIWAQIADKEALRLDGSGKYELEYSLHAPLNLPQYPGAITSDMNDDTIRQSVVEYTGWNTYVSHATEALSGEEKNMLNESKQAGVYLNAPVEKGYIGSYVWFDENYNAVIDEAAYERRSDGRLLYKNATKDLDHDGQIDDPGINGVKVELLTENGYPANKLGQAVVEVEENGVTKYIMIDETTGLKAKDANGTYLYTTEGPATYTTEADVYGNNGYFIISNITPGNYKLRYTLPEGIYNQYAVTTLESGAIGTTGENLNASKTKMDIYRPGDTLPDLGKKGKGDVTSDAMAITDNLVVQTHDSIRIDAVGTDTSKYAAYDERMTSYNLGVSRSYIYGGYAWVDETTDAYGNIISDGIYDRTKEMPLENVEVKFYEVVDGLLKEAYDVNGDVAECMTDANGYFEIYLYPNRTYLARTNTSKNTTGIYKPSPVTINTDPLLAEDDNDLTLTADKNQETFLIRTGILYDTDGNPITTTDDKDYNYGIYDYIGLGYVQAGRGFIGKYVWNDKNYDGIRGSYTEADVTVSEPGIENVELTLSKYYYDAESKEWKQTGENVTITSNSGGSYTFQNVSTYYELNSKIYLAGYKVEVNMDTIPEGYVITKYHINNGTDDSDLPILSTNGNSFLLSMNAYDLDSTGEYLIIADRASSTSNADYIYKDKGGISYDVESAKMILDLDLGLTLKEAGAISGKIWEDKTYDGLQNQYQVDEETTADEPGIENVELEAIQYYYKDNKWVQNNNYVSPTLITDADGNYQITGQETYVTIDGTKYLAGYKVRVKEIDRKYAVTKYHVGSNKAIDSDLVDKNLYLTSDKEYIILAKSITSADYAGDREYIITNNLGNFDVNKAVSSGNHDGGLVEYQKADLRGHIWDDKNYDGIFDESEVGIENTGLTLNQYYLDGDGKWKIAPEWTALTTVSDSDGAYCFEDLDSHVVVNGKHYLAGYRVIVDPETAPDKGVYGITIYRAGTAGERDSDLTDTYQIYHGDGEDGYSIIAAPAVGEIQNTPYIKEVGGVVYDYVIAVDNSNNDGGFTAYQSATISGNVFEDEDYDGFLDSEEGYANILAALEGEELIVTKETYYYGPEFKINHDDEVMPIDEGGSDDTIEDTTEEIKWRPYFAQDADGIWGHQTETAIVNPDGSYKFEDVPTQVYVEMEIDNEDGTVTETGAHYLAGYRLKISRIPKGFGTTLYLVNNGVSDSALYYENAEQGEILDIAKTHPTDGYNGSKMEEVDGYLIVAKPAQDGETYAVVKGFDLLRCRDLTEYNAGFHKDGEGKIEGTVFHDKDYDGIYRTDLEDGINGVTVYLDQYYLDSEGKWQKVEIGEEEVSYAQTITTTVGAEDGIFVFDKLPAKVTMDGIDYLTSYRIRIEEIPEGYAVTKLNQRTGEGEELDENRDSDMIASTGELVLGDGSDALDGYIVVAKQLTEDDVRNEEYIREYNGMEFDLQLSTTVHNYDAGLTDYQPGSIGGTIWLDNSENAETNYNGIQDEGEKGIEGQKVILTQFVYKEGLLGGRWEKVDDFGIEGKMETITDANGDYLFENLPVFRETEEGEKELLSYQLSVEELLEGYAVTKYRRGEDPMADSDLKVTTLELTTSKEYIVLAEDVTDAEYRNEEYVKAVKIGLLGDTYYYDIVVGEHNREYDGGYTPYLPGRISGLIWLDYRKGIEDESTNYNGIQDEGEAGIKGQKVLLTQYALVNNNWVQVDEFGTDGAMESITDANGYYQFENLPTYRMTEDGERQLLAYRVSVEELLEGYAVTKYRQGDDQAADSDLNAETLELTNEEEYIILAKDVTDEADRNEAYVLKMKTGLFSARYYDIVDGTECTEYDGGYTEYPLGSISGIAFVDGDGNGIYDEAADKLKSGVTIYLKKYYYDTESKTWLEVSEGFDAKTKTDKNGYYCFSKLPTYLKVEGQRYLIGYKLYLEEIADGYEVAEYQKNNGINDSALLEESLEIMKKDGSLKELMEGYIIVAGNNKDDEVRNQFNTIGDYDIANAMDREQYNVGLVKVVPEEPIEEPEEPIEEPEEPIEEPEEPIEEPETPVEKEEAVGTGDNSHMMSWFIIFMMSVCVCIIECKNRRRQKTRK